MVKQPKNSWLCGQACVAMVAGISLKKAIETLGHDGGTTTKEVSRALKKLGYVVPKRLKVIGKDEVFPKVYIAKIPNGSPRGWHWVVYYKGRRYDPSPDEFLKYKPPTSYLPVRKNLTS